MFCKTIFILRKPLQVEKIDIYVCSMNLHFASHQKIFCLFQVGINENLLLLWDEIVTKMSRPDFPCSYLKEINVIVK